MNIYADTSFFIAYHKTGDALHNQALALDAAYNEHDWLWCALHTIEVFITIRGLVNTPARLPYPLAQSMIGRIEQMLQAGAYQRVDFPWQESLKQTARVSEAHGWMRKFGPFDTWHVGAALALRVDYFVTFDRPQGTLADQAGLRVIGLKD